MKKDRVLSKGFIEKLVAMTASRELEWETIPEYFDNSKNEMLRKYIIAKNKYFYKMLQFYDKWPYLNEYATYCTKANGGLVIVFCSTTDDGKRVLELGIQPNTDSLIHVETGDEIEDAVASLYDTIENLETDLEHFVNGIMGEGDS